MGRKVINRIVFVWIMLIIVAALMGRVTVAAPNAGQTAADFLMIGVGARAAGMGGAYTAVAQGAIASYWNPAGLTSVKGGEVALGHFAWYQDVTLEHGTFAVSVSDRLSLAMSITYVNYGQIDGYNESGISTGDIQAYDWVSGVSAGYRLTDDFSVGLTGKFISQQLDDVGASAFAADFGVKYELSRLTLAAAVSNLGSEMEFESVSEKLPTSARFGVAAYPFNDWLLTSVAIEKRFNGGMVVQNGVEFCYDSHYFVRTGFNYYPSEDQRAFGSGLVMGAGFRMAGTEIDYAYTPKDKYSAQDLHRVSLVLKFGY